MSLLLSLKAENFEKNEGDEARRGIDFPILFVEIGWVVHEILPREEKTWWVSAIVVVFRQFYCSGRNHQKLPLTDFPE